MTTTSEIRVFENQLTQISLVKAESRLCLVRGANKGRQSKEYHVLLLFVFDFQNHMKKILRIQRQIQYKLTLAQQRNLLVTLPGSTTGSTDGVVELAALSESARLATGRSETTHFPMFGHRLAQPLRLDVVADGVVMGIDQHNLVKFECRILPDPVRVHNTQSGAATTNSFLKNISSLKFR
jgi:hypothetical protein